MRHLAVVPELTAAWEHQVVARRAEAAKIMHLLGYRDRCAAAAAGEPAVARAETERAAVRDAALVLGASERTTTILLNAAGFARQTLPRMWQAFLDGQVDLVRVRKVADAAAPELGEHCLRQLDSRAAVEAAHRGVADFQRWLTRYIAELNPEAYAADCERARQDRYVRFDHQPNGMSYLEAYLPTLEAAAIQNRLRAAARGLDSPPAHDHDRQNEAGQDQRDPGQEPTPMGSPVPMARGEAAGGDGRTLAQREADLLAVWLRDGRVYDAPVEAKIMVMVPEATLTGASDEPGVAADRSWRIPAGQARALAHNPNAAHQWYEGQVRPNRQEADYDLLTARYVGRYPPQRLRDALIFRDGVCQAPGCTISAQRCDIDHQHPNQDGGATTGSNLWALCRRHHRMKSHGLLHPSTPRSDIPTKSPPVEEPPLTPKRSGLRERRPVPPHRGPARATMTWTSTPIRILH
ncbi:HNH endonuclease [Nesterenkonia natronophila]|uniref:HNH endonuclease n=2 Tax=Nesterenkonia natronophila TaxID=2174932 RepID=A0A3A4F1J6_9MICC|nr:HNH endonuclease [Nesterenkonia natronophila]